LSALAEQLSRWELVPTGTEGYRKAEVTAGGVDTRCLSSQTMESSQSGLYFIGEVVDVTGWLGGYNFQWAWASALRLRARAGPCAAKFVGKASARRSGTAIISGFSGITPSANTSYRRGKPLNVACGARSPP
jgi:hypothetical protein